MGPYRRTCALEHFGEQHTFTAGRCAFPSLSVVRGIIFSSARVSANGFGIAANRDGGRPGLCQKRRCCGKQRQEDRNELRVSLMQTA